MTKKEMTIFAILTIAIIFANSIALFFLNGISFNTVMGFIMLLMCSIVLSFMIVATYIFIKERRLSSIILGILLSLTALFMNLTIITMYTNLYFYGITGILITIDALFITVDGIRRRFKQESN